MMWHSRDIKNRKGAYYHTITIMTPVTKNIGLQKVKLKYAQSIK